MAASPPIVFDETIPMSASAFDGFPVRAGIDRGLSLTKIAFVPKDAPSDTDTVPLRCLTFRNADFEGALRMMKAEAQVPDKGELHVTGIGGANFKDLIEDILGLDVVFIHEFVTIGRGPYLLINNAKPEHVFHPVPKVKEFRYEREMLEKFQAFLAQQEAVEDINEDASFPGLVMYVGSGAAMMHVSKEGISKYVGGISLSGRPFLGMGNILLGTNDYNEIMSLASKGDHCRIDSQVKDIMNDDPGSPYGRFPEDIAVFPFGKASDPTMPRDKYKREDLAQSLVAFYAAEMVSFLMTGIAITGMKRAYLVGNFFRAEIVQRLIYEKLFMYGQEAKVFKVVNTGHTGVIAAMLTRPEDMDRLLAV